MKKIKPVVLIMTATITPPPKVPDLIRKDPKIRLNDYCESLKFYLQISSTVVDRIIFIENSNSDIKDLEQLAKNINHNKKVEFISFPDGNIYPLEYGKAYGEFKMINYGLYKSSMISDTDIFWKTTGRHQLLNIESLIKKAPENYIIYCDLRNIPFLVGQQATAIKKWMDLRFFSFTMEGYNKYFRDNVNNLRGALMNIHPEQYMYGVIKKAMMTELIIPRFAIQPIVAGYCGFNNRNYQSLRYKFTNLIRSLARFIAPWLWV